jgi:hypothetical protein
MWGSSHSLIEYTFGYKRIFDTLMATEGIDCCDVLSFVSDAMDQSMREFIGNKVSWYKSYQPSPYETFQITELTTYLEQEGGGRPRTNQKFDDLVKEKCGGPCRPRGRLGAVYAAEILRHSRLPKMTAIPDDRKLPDHGDEAHRMRLDEDYREWYYERGRPVPRVVVVQSLEERLAARYPNFFAYRVALQREAANRARLNRIRTGR